VSKPKAEIFDIAFAELGVEATRDAAVMVGDSLSSDMQGAINAGIATCWYNPRRVAWMATGASITSCPTRRARWIVLGSSLGAERRSNDEGAVDCEGQSWICWRGRRPRPAAHQLELGFQPVGVLFFALEDVLEQLAAAAVTDLEARGDSGVEPCDRLDLELEGEVELLDGRLAHPHRAEALQVGDTVEEQDPLDEGVGILHLVDRLVPKALARRL